MPNPPIEPIVKDIVEAVQRIFEKHPITPEDYRAAVGFLHEVGETGEVPLIMDVFFEALVVDEYNRGRQSTSRNLLGPFYLEGAPYLEDGRLLSENEVGDRLVMFGTICNLDGEPLAGAELDVWQADAEGRYSGFNPEPAEMNLRGRLRSGTDGSYQLHTVRPEGYTIPHDGPTGRLLTALGRHPWRPAHIHLKASHAGYLPIITQVYFSNTKHLDSDVATAVRNDLVRPLKPTDEGYSLEFDVVLEPTA
jgi:catechol 1,2-dioxygenase